MTDHGQRDRVPDFVPTAAFTAIDFVEEHGMPVDEWQRRLLIDMFGAGPVVTTCTCGVLTGGARDARPNCEVHGGQ